MDNRKELTENQNNLMFLMDSCMALSGNIQFFDQLRKGNQSLEMGFKANVDGFNSIMIVIDNIKKATPKEEYDFLLADSKVFQKFHELFLKEERIEIEIKPKSTIILPGDPR